MQEWGADSLPVFFRLDTPGYVGARNIIAHPAPEVNRQNKQNFIFVQNAQKPKGTKVTKNKGFTLLKMTKQKTKLFLDFCGLIVYN